MKKAALVLLSVVVLAGNAQVFCAETKEYRRISDRIAVIFNGPVHRKALTDAKAGALLGGVGMAGLDISFGGFSSTAIPLAGTAAGAGALSVYIGSRVDQASGKGAKGLALGTLAGGVASGLGFSAIETIKGIRAVSKEVSPLSFANFWGTVYRNFSKPVFAPTAVVAATVTGIILVINRIYAVRN